ncbi:hypothetical protein NXY56_003369 [Leishmania guyanensis]
MSHSTQPAMSLDNSAVSDMMTSTSILALSADVSSPSANNCSQGSGSTFGNGDSRGSGGFFFGSPPASLSELLGAFAYAVSLQSRTSWLLAVMFHLFHLLLILVLLSSSILFRATVFSFQTMPKSLLHAQSVTKQKGSSNENSHNGTAGLSASAEKDPSGVEAAVMLHSSFSQASISVESV